MSPARHIARLSHPCGSIPVKCDRKFPSSCPSLPALFDLIPALSAMCLDTTLKPQKLAEVSATLGIGGRGEPRNLAGSIWQGKYLLAFFPFLISFPSFLISSRSVCGRSAGRILMEGTAIGGRERRGLESNCQATIKVFQDLFPVL